MPCGWLGSQRDRIVVVVVAKHGGSSRRAGVLYDKLEGGCAGDSVCEELPVWVWWPIEEENCGCGGHDAIMICEGLGSDATGRLLRPTKSSGRSRLAPNRRGPSSCRTRCGE